MIFIQINITINRITLTREATKNEVERVYSKIYSWMPQKLPIVIFLQSTVTLLKIIGA